VVATFGPDGIFAHPDHIAIGAATDAAFLRSAATGGTAFRRLLHGGIPQSVFERWQRVVSRDWAVVAWPEREPSSPVLTDIFEGLP
jgi:LmbE family N-acetylglucosaminyl deacetylase